MKSKPTFFEGMTVALIASIVITVCAFVISHVFFSTGFLQILIACASAAYIGYLMIRSRERLGRLTVFATWSVVSVTAMIFAPSLAVFLVLQLSMIWVVRSLYYYNSLLTALADLGLMGLSTFVGLWVWLSTGSLLLSLWCFFLMQALFVFIPKHLKQSGSGGSVTHAPSAHFEHAYLAAENAVRQLSLVQSKH